MQEILLKIRHFERGLSKTFEKLSLFVLSNPVPFDGQVIKNKSGLELLTSRSSGSQVHKNFFISFILSDQV